MAVPWSAWDRLKLSIGFVSGKQRMGVQAGGTFGGAQGISFGRL